MEISALVVCLGLAVVGLVLSYLCTPRKGGAR